MLETRTRTIVKAVGWQALGLIVTAAIGWLVTGSWMQSSTLSATIAVVGLIAYVLYERLWLAIGWGRVGQSTTNSSRR